MYPSVVFECTKTEHEGDVIEDTKQWLEKIGGYIKLVVIATVEEGRIRGSIGRWRL